MWLYSKIVQAIFIPFLIEGERCSGDNCNNGELFYGCAGAGAYIYDGILDLWPPCTWLPTMHWQPRRSQVDRVIPWYLWGEQTEIWIGETWSHVKAIFLEKTGHHSIGTAKWSRSKWLRLYAPFYAGNSTKRTDLILSLCCPCVFRIVFRKSHESHNPRKDLPCTRTTFKVLSR